MLELIYLCLDVTPSRVNLGPKKALIGFMNWLFKSDISLVTNSPAGFPLIVYFFDPPKKISIIIVENTSTVNYDTLN